MIEFLSSDLSGPLSVTFMALEAGQASDVVPFAVRNAGSEDLVDVLVVLQVESPTTPGLYVSTGVPPQDELWGRIRLTGQDAAAAPAQQDLRTDWTPIGAWSALLVPTLLAGGIRYGEIKMRPPSTAAGAVSYRWALSAVTAEHSRALPAPLAAACAGVLPQVGDRGAGHLLRGFAVLASATPDDQVHVAAGVAIVRGDVVTKLATDVTLSQLDSAAGSLLAPGESYRASLSLSSLGSLTVTKGLKAISSRPPAPPAGEVLIDQVLVRYQPGGTSIVEASDVAGAAVYGRHLAVAGDGLAVRIHPGQAIAGGTWRYWTSPQDLALPASATSWLWQWSSGQFGVLAAGEAPPETTALGPLWEIDTDATGVVALRDLRTFTRPPVILHLAGALPGAGPGEVDSLLVHQALQVERIVFRLSDNGGGSSGQTVLDLEVSGETTFVSQATDDQRPAWAFDAVGVGGELVDDDGIHELVQIRPGDVLTLRSAEHPTGGTPAWAEAYLICW